MGITLDTNLSLKCWGAWPGKMAQQVGAFAAQHEDGSLTLSTYTVSQAWPRMCVTPMW